MKNGNWIWWVDFWYRCGTEGRRDEGEGMRYKAYGV